MKNILTFLHTFSYMYRSGISKTTTGYQASLVSNPRCPFVLRVTSSEGAEASESSPDIFELAQDQAARDAPRLCGWCYRRLVRRREGQNGDENGLRAGRELGRVLRDLGERNR